MLKSFIITQLLKFDLEVVWQPVHGSHYTQCGVKFRKITICIKKTETLERNNLRISSFSNKIIRITQYPQPINITNTKFNQNHPLRNRLLHYKSIWNISLLPIQVHEVGTVHRSTCFLQSLFDFTNCFTQYIDGTSSLVETLVFNFLSAKEFIV